MQPTTPVWPGWVGTALANAASYRLSWSEFCALQQRALRGDQGQQRDALLSERELARLAFVRWLCQTGRLDPANRQPTITSPDEVSSGCHHIVSAIAHLQEAVTDLDAALAFSSIPEVFAAGSDRLRDLDSEMEALLAQLDAHRVQFAEYAQAAEDDAGLDVP